MLFPRIRRHLGRRGALLVIVGAGEIIWGLQFVLDPAPNPQGLTLLTEVAPVHYWAWMWVVAGVAAVSAACVRIGHDWPGFAAALAPPTVWSTAYVAAGLAGEYTRGLWIAAWYLSSHVGVIMWASAIPEFSAPAAVPAARPVKEGAA
ncbi:hypothetical protein [Streptomyces sp. NPDC049881]|uniref:hypothetical protein n=1 Tax=unclassified Streptomyces TaxID=2593676 RepID=UPI0034307079